MGTILDVTATLVALMMIAVQFALYRAASGRPSAAALPLIIVVAVLTAPAILLLLSRVSSAVESAERRWIAAGRPTDPSAD